MVQQDVGQLRAGVEQLQQQTQAVVHERVLIQRVLQQTQHRDDTALPERGDVLHILQIQTERREQYWLSLGLQRLVNINKNVDDKKSSTHIFVGE